MYYKLSRLLLTPTAARPSTTVEVFIANPQIDQESILGKLFFLAEIESTKPAALKLVQFFSTALPQAYYQSEKLSLREKMGTLNITELFETALTKVNAECETFCKKEKVKLAPKTINIVCGVVYKNKLAFSGNGSLKGLLVYPEAKTANDELDTKKLYKITPLELTSPDEKKTSLQKFFTSVSEGAIPPEGYAIFTNEILPEYITNKHLSKIITTLPPTSAVEQIKNQLHKINSYVTFAALIIKNSTTPHVQRTIPRLNVNVTAQNSLEQMQEIESATERHLASAGAVRTQRLWLVIKNMAGKLPFSAHKNLGLTIRDKIFFTKKSHRRLLTHLAGAARNISRISSGLASYIWRALSHPRQSGAKMAAVARILYYRTKQLFLKILHWFVRLSMLHRVLLGIFLLFSMLFTLNIYSLVHNKQQTTDRQNYQELTQTIRQKQNQIEASLLYHNETGARELLDETQALINELARYSIADQNLIAQLRQTNEQQLANISHVIAATPHELTQFNRLNADARPDILVAQKDAILAGDSTHHTLYRLQNDNAAAGILSDAITAVFGVALDPDTAIFISAKNGTMVTGAATLATIDVAFAGSENDITNITSYNGRLYLLSKTQNSIVRFSPNYQTKTAWLKEDLNLSDVVDLAIDGYIYLLKANGEVVRLLSGYTNAFRLSEVTPPLAATTKIQLSGDSETGFVYILEPAQKRIVVFDKKGAFVQQYKINLDADIADFAVLEQDKKIALLAGASLYELDTSDLK
jgi:hypothetical protein